MAPGPLHPGWRSLFELNTIEGGPLTSLFPHSPLHTLTNLTFAYQPFGAKHPSLRYHIYHTFTAPDEISFASLDTLLVTA